jgi:succinate dehydrogenase flavin-adding protein (antitoxin of CptAB toxin-antitoxin module)
VAAGLVSAEDLRRLRWRSRRGLLENDLILDRFFRRTGDRLEATAAADLAELLAHDDPTLWDILSGRAEPDPRLKGIVERLRQS